jgi:N-acetylmuramoyl-L-alanine amidase
MSRRFGPQPYRDKAIEAYKLLIKEYPHSPLSAQAKKKLEELAVPAEAPTEDAAAEEEERPQKESSADEAAASAPAPGRLPRVLSVRHWSSPGVTRVVVELEADVKARSDRLSNPERVYFDLPNTRLSPELKNKTIEVGDALVKQVRLAHTQIGVTRVVVDLNSDAEHSVSTLTNPPRVVVELRPRGTTKPAEVTAAKPAEARPAPAPPRAETVKLAPPKPAQPTSSGERDLVRALGLKVGRVVVDPGHGGHDTGTIGPSGLTEKEITLDIATRLGNLISDRIGSEVIFTRTDDTFIALEDRTGLANEKGADLFISIHANSSRARTVRGIETYYLNLTADPDALEVAARENAASRKSIHELQDLVSKITLTEKVSESREFATQVQRYLYAAAAKENGALRNRGIRKAPFVVLIGARMPSVLAEISFLSNPRDEKLLRTPAYRQKIAEALYNGVANYARGLSRMEVAAK